MGSTMTCPSQERGSPGCDLKRGGCWALTKERGLLGYDLLGEEEGETGWSRGPGAVAAEAEARSAASRSHGFAFTR